MKPSDLKKKAKKLIADGEMPSLHELMAAIESVRAAYGPKIKAARTEAIQKRTGKRADGM